MESIKLPEDFMTYSESRKQTFMNLKTLKESGRRVAGTFYKYTPPWG